MAAVGFIGRLPVALVLGWLFVRRGSLWAPIGLHAAFNGILLVAAEAALRSAWCRSGRGLSVCGPWLWLHSPLTRVLDEEDEPYGSV